MIKAINEAHAFEHIKQKFFFLAFNKLSTLLVRTFSDKLDFKILIGVVLLMF